MVGSFNYDFSFAQAAVREVSLSSSSSSDSSHNSDAEIPGDEKSIVAGASILLTVVGLPALAPELSTVVESDVLSPTSPWCAELAKTNEKPKADIPAEPAASSANEQPNVAAQPQTPKA